MTDDAIPLDEEEEPTAPFWMATFSDMMTLLLTFFVMLVAMSEVEVKKFEEAMSYFTGRRGVLESEGLMAGIMGVASQPDARDQARAFEDLARDIQEQGLGDAVDVDLTARGVRLTFVDEIAFGSGSAELGGPAQDVLRRTAEAARGVGAIEVEGHTDDQPIATAAYPSNWELSAARAAAVVRFLLEQPGALEPDQYLASGHAEHRPRDTNDTAEGRARNRRISVLFRTADAPDGPAGDLLPIPSPDVRP